MHFYSTTFDNKERTLEINQIMGKRFSLLKNLKMGGTGSSRMLVQSVSPSLETVMNRISNVNYSSLEIRPKGIIVHFVQQGLKSWCWLLPWNELRIDEKEGLIISNLKDFVKFKRDSRLQSNKVFIQKINTLQNNFLQNKF